MTALASSFVSSTNPKIQCSLSEPMNRSLLSPSNLSFNPIHQRKAKLSTYNKSLVVRAGRDRGQSNSAGIFVGGFVLGGIVAGTLGCVYAPQIAENMLRKFESLVDDDFYKFIISKALAGAPDKKELMRKLPKFIYDEEKALEKTRQILTEKIAQLSSAIDDVSSQLRSDGAPNGVATKDKRERKGFASSSGGRRVHVYSSCTDSWRCIDDATLSAAHPDLHLYRNKQRTVPEWQPFLYGILPD